MMRQKYVRNAYAASRCCDDLSTPRKDHVVLRRMAFKDATSVPYGYLLVDLKQDTPEDMRLRTTISPDDGVQYMYLPKV